MAAPSHSHITLTIEGMSCAACSTRLEASLQKLPGVQEAHVNLTTEKATITGTASINELISAIEATGFTASLTEAKTSFQAETERKERHRKARRILQRDLIISASLWGVIMLLPMGLKMAHALPAYLSPYLQWGLATVALLGPGRRFYQTGIPALIKRSPNMQSLVAIGTLAAYFYSSLVTFFPAILPEATRHLYFEAAIGIITLVLLGRVLEVHAKGKTSAALEALTKLQPQEAHVQRDGMLIDLPIEQIQPGDILTIRPGERIPLDGCILSGESHIDESMITGEPLPVFRTVGETIIGGTINQEGALSCKATAIGADTMLARIITMVEQAQNGKLPIQSLVDKVTLWFVPAIIALAAITFLFWLLLGPAPSFSYALVNAIAVLIAACPCAMGLATPTAIMVGTGKGAELGILLRKGEALQTLEATRIVAFDKTGTLTEGRPHLTDFHIFTPQNRSALLALIASVERHSEHPLAHAIIQKAEAQKLPSCSISHFRAITGMGVEAYDEEGASIHIGNAAFMQTLSLTNTVATALANTLSTQGRTPIYVAYKGEIAALLAISDPLRPSAKQTISALKSRGIRTALITGDVTPTARYIAEQAGVEDVIAELLPHEKSEAVQKLQQRHGPLTFVGDGINDAPALAQADTGIAICHGTDIAIEAADIVLTSETLMSIPHAISLSRSTLSIIRQNLFWAFAYNIILIPLAAGILYPATHLLLSPLWAAGAMALSSVFVLSNTLRLRHFSP